MAKPTTTLAQIRRALCLEAGFYFYQRFPLGYSTMTAGGTTLTLLDTALTQSDDFWNNVWFYGVDGKNLGQTTLITDWTKSGAVLVPERAMVAADALDKYELIQMWSAPQIHRAINDAIRQGHPSFFDTYTDESLVVKTDTLEYSMTALSYLPWIISNIYVEDPGSVTRGTATAGAAGYITDSTQNFASLTTAYKVSIYDGTGAGQVRTVSTGTAGGQINVSAVWTTVPDTTSKYALWNPSDQLYPWRRLTAVRTDQPEYPSTLYFPQASLTAYEGMRFRIEYATVPVTLVLEASTTAVPQQYIVYQALGDLHDALVANNRADRNMHLTSAQLYKDKAKEFKENNAFRIADITVWQEEDHALNTKNSSSPLW